MKTKKTRKAKKNIQETKPIDTSGRFVTLTRNSPKEIWEVGCISLDSIQACASARETFDQERNLGNKKFQILVLREEDEQAGEYNKSLPLPPSAPKPKVVAAPIPPIPSTISEISTPKCAEMGVVGSEMPVHRKRGWPKGKPRKAPGTTVPVAKPKGKRGWPKGKPRKPGGISTVPNPPPPNADAIHSETGQFLGNIKVIQENPNAAKIELPPIKEVIGPAICNVNAVAKVSVNVPSGPINGRPETTLERLQRITKERKEKENKG